MFRAGWVLVLVMTCGLSACGPVRYGVHVTSRANAAMTAARSAGADKLAPYEYFQATEYLHKAREEGAYSQYQNALYYGKKAEDMANKAMQIAQERAAKGEGAAPTAVGDKPEKPDKPGTDKPGADKDKGAKPAPKPVKPDPDAPAGSEENPRPPTP